MKIRSTPPGRETVALSVKRKGSTVARAATDKSRGKFANGPLPGKTRIGIVLYPGAKLAAVHGLTDLFETANRFSAELGGGHRAELRISHWDAHAETAQVACVFGAEAHQDIRPDCLIFPPTLEIDQAGARTDALLQWAGACHASGATLCSVCGGAFVLARLGLLNGRTATTHWSYSGVFATSFPEICVKTDELIVDLGDVVTAGGVMAWLDLGLKLVDRYLGPLAMMRTAQFFLVDPAGRQQRYYANFSPPMHHGDPAILKVQLWLQSTAFQPVPIELMASRAKLGQRTFLRRFQKATGQTPTEYVQHLKVHKARELLEFTTLSVKEISWKVGYEDTGTLRKVFDRFLGLTPTDYRRRFGTGDRIAT
jgi:transcriptional regulator GlxA family with amidase domain